MSVTFEEGSMTQTQQSRRDILRTAAAFSAAASFAEIGTTRAVGAVEKETAPMSSDDILQPTYTKKMRILGHSDQGGRADGVQIMVHKGYAYVGHIFSKGFSVVDVRDPKNPKPVNYMPTPPNTWSIHLQNYEYCW
jgi:hypothetical protein